MEKYNKKFLQKAHGASIYHEAKIRNSKICGCFYCKRTFDAKEIIEWTDEGAKKDRTAICPYCIIDSVIDDEYPIEDKEFMDQMNKHWF